jgi:hypothetical protein
VEKLPALCISGRRAAKKQLDLVPIPRSIHKCPNQIQLEQKIHQASNQCRGILLLQMVVEQSDTKEVISKHIVEQV